MNPTTGTKIWQTPLGAWVLLFSPVSCSATVFSLLSGVPPLSFQLWCCGLLLLSLRRHHQEVHRRRGLWYLVRPCPGRCVASSLFFTRVVVVVAHGVLLYVTPPLSPISLGPSPFPSHTRARHLIACASVPMWKFVCTCVCGCACVCICVGVPQATCTPSRPRVWSTGSCPLGLRPPSPSGPTTRCTLAALTCACEGVCSLFKQGAGGWEQGTGLLVGCRVLCVSVCVFRLETKGAHCPVDRPARALCSCA